MEEVELNSHCRESPVHQVFHIPELLEIILLHLLDNELQNDRRNMTVVHNARLLKQAFKTSRVSSAFHRALARSMALRKRLFLCPDPACGRSWDHKPSSSLPMALGQFYRHEACAGQLPYLNPLVAVELCDLSFRFWHLPVQEGEHKHCAFMLVSRDNIVEFQRRHQAPGRQTVVCNMLLSQPPCYRMDCVVFEDRDETRDYLGRTTDIDDPCIVSKTGLTIGLICSELRRIFEQHQDIARVKLTTV